MEDWLDTKNVYLTDMNKARELINKHKKDFPEATYYLGLIDVAEENLLKMPDVSIETCKSLFEGVSKTILKNADVPFAENGRNADSPSKLLKMALGEIKKYTLIEDSFIQNACGTVQRMTNIRNDRGDVSHGKLAPKLEQSDYATASMIMGVTDSIIGYILNCFFQIDWSSVEYLKYEENEEFNQSLDKDYDFGSISYSKALFDQDPIAYSLQLQDYKDGQI
jgi:hypothetical protein